MADRALTREQILTVLQSTPSRLGVLTAGLTPEQLHAPPAPDEWSAVAVLAHMRACADVWGGCIQRILAEDHPTLRAINPRTWIKRTDYPDLAFQASLDAFAAQRRAQLAALEPLPPEGWQRGATVTGAGAALERTVHVYA